MVAAPRVGVMQPRRDPMSDEASAYLLASSVMPPDHGELDAYGEASHEIFAAAGVEVVAWGSAGRLSGPGQEVEVVEGTWPEHASMTIFKFPSMKVLKEVWFGDAYQSIKHLRTDVIAPNVALIVPGADVPL